MCRVGTANYHNSLLSADNLDVYWRELLNREQRRHRYSALNEPPPRSNLQSATSHEKETRAGPWKMLSQTYSIAAGKSSYHHNARKPLGWVKHPMPTSANWERRLPGFDYDLDRPLFTAEPRRPSTAQEKHTRSRSQRSHRSSRERPLSRASSCSSGRGMIVPVY